MKKTDKKDLKNRLVALHEPSSPQAEYFRTIKTNIEMMNIDSKVKSLLITSPTQDSGKTMISVNLASTYANDGVKTLLIDLDLRRPSLGFAIPIVKASPGLTGILDSSQNLTPEDVIVPVTDTNLYVLPVGARPLSPYSILNSAKLGQLIEQLKEIFDMIIIDTPPVMMVKDALLVSKWAEASVLIARGGYSNKIDIKKSLKNMQDANANILGVIFNNPQMKQDHYYYPESEV
ncbi:CpsD/CapB family tyrosine-protein kinase [Listeria fleischmannii]|uniref:non-specific protein-tyrosine kinase n=1 Tax=Listeria fleischmannii TaxID=1069827 RepID=A0A841YCR9_9LIST|nr:CpsD/CapB family tyrosine-protein kinase [Listeria fleischmannii]EIA20222.1 capsular exopolysaccharide family protein [Listeria fleischmannii subsp. coloradonensis]MBC1398040.1 CpsD/CapB family tyrosine-protein kinase [Listeria fleischmannii]MBC1417882.1 CpsD/CapB family tyrosine-protein kinase [Listeria fleischmannii]MBC1426101.1 CpsD/CapB family tyrosine-protein kinase [Listeria fleischmannii]STY34374.1 Tyrosine-protein kinase YwqD [Listeria fleischmannii subsp. coloradonensis]